MLYEYRPAIKRKGAPHLVSKEDMNRVVGFTSVFGFPDETQQMIKLNRSTAGLHNADLYCDTLYLDFDNNPVAEDRAEQWLKQENIRYSIYHTGNRGKHFHIPIQPMCRKGLPYKFKKWVGEYFPSADLSIYKPSGIIRLPNTPHLKNPGSRKRLLEVSAGKLLDFSAYPVTESVPIQEEYTGDSDFGVLALFYVFCVVGEGRRNEHCNKIIWACHEAGLDPDTCRMLVQHWNNNYCIPSQAESVCQSNIQRVYGLQG